MQSTSITCQACRAPGQTTPGQTIYTCPYCKVSYQLALPPPPPMQQPYGMPFGQQQQQQYEIPRMVVPVGRYRSGTSAAWVGVLIPLVIVCIVVVAVFGRSLFGGLGWDGTETFVCGGNDDITVSNVDANVKGGTVISAGGNCTLHVKQCNLKGAVGIEADGNAHVYVEQGTLEATDTAVDATGNAHVELHGTKMTGPKKANANAKIVGP